MSMQLYIISNSVTLDFMANGYKVIDGFFPEEPGEGAESVTEQFSVLITGSSESDLRSKINAIRLAILHAKLHKDDYLAAYLYYDVSSTGDAWMSKILDGEYHYSDKLVRRWNNNKAIINIVIEHEPYWDAKDEVQVPLTNGNGTNDTSGLKVYNHDDGGGTSPSHHDNWVDIAAADVLGDLPGPTRLEITNTYATNLIRWMWIGQNFTDPDNLTHIIEGETSSTGTEQSEASCSGGKYRQYVLSGSAENTMFTWSLSSSFLNSCKAQYYKIMARFYFTVPTNVKFRLQLKYQNIVIWQSGQISLDTSVAIEIRDLFTLRLPPWLLMQTSLAGLSMLITGQHISGSSTNVNLDFLQVTSLDGYRALQFAGYGAAQNERIMDDGFLGNVYVDNGSGSNKAGIILGYGNQINLYPGKKQRLYFLMHSDVANTGEIDRTITVKLYYRPRRKSL
jgi:hypothetical protein